MSLCRIAWRLVCVEALKGRTLVGDNVLDSEIGALDLDPRGQLQTDRRKPFLAVYTDQAEASAVSPRGLFENGQTLLRIEIGLTEKMVIEQPDPEVEGKYFEEVVAGIPYTRGSFELTLDLIARQVVAALSDPQGEFSSVFNGLMTRLIKVERQRASGGSDGERVAAQQISITADLLADPITVADVPEAGPLARCLSLFEERGGNLANVASLMRAEIAAAGEDWSVLQSRLGLTASELLSLGHGPVAGDDEQSTPEMSGVDLDVQGHGQESVTADV